MQIEQGLRSGLAFTVRRSQILLMRAEEQLTPKHIAGRLGCSDQCVREGLHAFNERGTASLQPQSRARHDQQSAFDEAGRVRLKGLLEQSPCELGYDSSLWSLPLLAQAAYAEGLTSWLVDADTVGRTLRHVRVRWQRAKHWIESPDAHYTAKKKRRDWLKAQAQAHTDWLLFDEDECWFSRFAQPQAHAWAAQGRPLRLVQPAIPPKTEYKALACYGAVRQDTQQVALSFTSGQPNSADTLAFLPHLLMVARREHKQVVVVIWDNASWHKAKAVRSWIHTHNRQAKRDHDVRLLTCLLPKQSPWLNPIEPRWIHAKRKVCEPHDTRSPLELKRRLAAHFKTIPFAA